MSDLLRRLRYPLTYLVLSVMCTLSIVSGEWPSDLTPGSKLVLELASPLQRTVTFPVRRLRDFFDQYVALVDIRADFDAVVLENAQLRKEVVEYREAVEASERFERFGDLRDSQNLPMIPANVAAQDLSPWFRSITIDRGSSHGVKPGMAVITDYGVVGLVAGVAPRFARVLLVTDAQSRVDSFSQRTRVRGTVRGSPDGRCVVDYVLRDDDLRIGDLMLTTGRGGLYPKGLVIGTVAGLERTASGLFQSVQLEPAVAFRRLEEVFVILERTELPDPDDFSIQNDELWAGAASQGPAEAERSALPPGQGEAGPAAPDTRVR